MYTLPYSIHTLLERFVICFIYFLRAAEAAAAAVDDSDAETVLAAMHTEAPLALNLLLAPLDQLAGPDAVALMQTKSFRDAAAEAKKTWNQEIKRK